MAQPKRFDINKVENFLKNSADKAQTLGYWNAAVEQGKTVKFIDENLASNVDDDLDGKKRAIDRLMVSNKKLREDSIANGKMVDEEDYVAACQELLQKRSDIKTKIEALLKSGDGGAILRSLEDAEQRLVDARVNSAADKSSKKGTSPQKEPEPDDEQKELDGHNADDRQEPRNKAKSFPIEAFSMHSRSDKTKSNKTSVISKTSSAIRVLHLELKSSERARRTAKAPGETGTRSKREGDSRLARRGGPQSQNC